MIPTPGILASRGSFDDVQDHSELCDKESGSCCSFVIGGQGCKRSFPAQHSPDNRSIAEGSGQKMLPTPTSAPFPGSLLMGIAAFSPSCSLRHILDFGHKLILTGEKSAVTGTLQTSPRTFSSTGLCEITMFPQPFV